MERAPPAAPLFWIRACVSVLDVYYYPIVFWRMDYDDIGGCVLVVHAFKVSSSFTWMHRCRFTSGLGFFELLRRRWLLDDNANRRRQAYIVPVIKYYYTLLTPYAVRYRFATAVTANNPPSCYGPDFKLCGNYFSASCTCILYRII